MGTTRRQRLWQLAAAAVAVFVLLPGFGLVWLFTNAHRDRDAWLDEREGQLGGIERESVTAPRGLIAERLRLESDSGLAVTLVVLRPAAQSGPLPLLLVLGGHRTGSDAVRLFDDPGNRVVVAYDYPYDGPLRTDGFWQSVTAVPAVRSAFLDAAPAISLSLDWLLEQPWADRGEVTMAGVSLGVPFATTAAARDDRITRLMLVHGAADNREWILHNLDRRLDVGPLQPFAATLLNWVVYGPLHDTRAQIGTLAPRPVIVVGARDDERVPEGQTEALYDAAGEPKTLRWTDGRHVQPGRTEVVDALLALLDDTDR